MAFIVTYLESLSGETGSFSMIVDNYVERIMPANYASMRSAGVSLSKKGVHFCDAFNFTFSLEADVFNVLESRCPYCTVIM